MTRGPMSTLMFVCMLLTVADAACSNYTIGFIWPITLGYAVLDPAAVAMCPECYELREAASAFFLAVGSAAANPAVPVIVPHVIDIGLDINPPGAKYMNIKWTREIVSNPCNIGLMGPLMQDLTPHIATMASLYNKVLLAPTSPSAELIDKEDYPTLFRLLPSSYFASMPAFCQSNNWTNVAVIYDLFFQDSVEPMLNQLKARGIHVVTSSLVRVDIYEGPSSWAETEVEMERVLRSLRQQGLRITIVLTGVEVVRALEKVSTTLQMNGDPYIWMFPFLGTAGLPASLEAFHTLQGAVAFDATYPVTDAVESATWAAVATTGPYDAVWDNGDGKLDWMAVVFWRGVRALAEGAQAILDKGQDPTNGTLMVAELLARTSEPLFNPQQDLYADTTILTRINGTGHEFARYSPSSDSIVTNGVEPQYGWTPGPLGLTDGSYTDPEKSTVDSHVDFGTVGRTETFHIDGRNSFGAETNTPPGHSFEVTFSDAGTVVRILSEENGTTTVEYTPATAGQHTVRIELYGKAVAASPYTMTVEEKPTVAEESNNTALIATVVILISLFFCVIAVFAVYVRFAPKTTSLDPLYDINLDDVVMMRQLGVGAYGEVFYGDWRGSEVAVKVLKSGSSMSRAAYNDFVSEIGIMCQLRHPNCLLFMGASTDPARMCIVTEFMEMGDVFTLLHDENADIPYARRFKWLSDTCKGMTFLHAASPPILHRDLKSLNLLVTGSWDVKVADFGLSGIVAKEEDAMGTLYWTAPEVLDDPANFTTAADVYSFGIIIWEIVTREDLFPGVNVFSVALRVQSGGRPMFADDYPTRVKELAEKCWAQDPADRVDFPTALTDIRSIISEMGFGTASSFAGSSVFASKEMATGATTVPPPQSECAAVVTTIPNDNEIWECDPQAMEHAMLELRQVVNKLVAKHKGYESKGNRDASTMVHIFQVPHHALLFAIGLQTSLLERPWMEELLAVSFCREERDGEGKLCQRGLRVSIGINFAIAEASQNATTARAEFGGALLADALAASREAGAGQILATQDIINELHDVMSKIEAVATVSPRQGSVEGALVEVVPHELEGRRFRLGGAGGSEDSLALPSFVGGTTPQEKSTKSQLMVEYKDITFGERIGAGSFGETFKSVFKGETVAVKRLLRKALQGELYLNFRAEVSLMCMLDHENVIGIKGFTDPPIMSILMEFAEKGSLDTIIGDPTEALSHDLKISLLTGVASAMAYLHGRRPPIVHRDLKPANVLIMDDWTPKVCDFGLARVKSTMQTMTQCGTVGFAAPEILRGEKHDETVDIFSYAVLALHVYTRENPYKDKKNPVRLAHAIAHKGYRAPIPESCPENLASAIAACWDETPSVRPPFSEVVVRLNA